MMELPVLLPNREFGVNGNIFPVVLPNRELFEVDDGGMMELPVLLLPLVVGFLADKKGFALLDWPPKL
jgi:hypothetical protein